MRKVFICIVELIFVIACTMKTSNGHDKSNAEPLISAQISQSIIKTIGTDSTAYLKNIGSEILDGEKISKIDEKYIYRSIDSIFVTGSTDIAFYFKVFNKIREQAREYLREYVDLQTREYCRKYPNEFFCMTDSVLESYAYDIGEEIRTEEEDPSQFAKDYILEIKEKCNPKYFQKVETFSKNLFDKIESRK